MELELYELVNSDICKLVYGFLLDCDLFHIAVEFLNNSKYLIEFAKARRQNKMFIHKVNGLTLRQWLEKASMIYSMEQYVQQRCSQFKVDKLKLENKNLLEQLDILLRHVQKRTMQSKISSEYVHSNPISEDNYDEDLLKKLTEKDKKILVDVFDNKDVVSEHLAQKIAEELNKRPYEGASVDDIAHQVAENTASDDIFHDLCAEMYEEGFLLESERKTFKSPKKQSTQKSLSTTPSRGVKSSPIKELITPSPPIEAQPLSAMAISNQTNSVTMAITSGDKAYSNSTIIEGDKSYHVLRPMSIDADVSSVASVSSMNTSASVSSYSTYTNETPVGSSRYTVIPPPPQHKSPNTPHFIMPLQHNGTANSSVQPTSLILLPSNIIIQSNVNETLGPANSRTSDITPLPFSSPVRNQIQTAVPSPVLNPFQKRYANVRPKHPRVKDKQNSQPYHIIVQVPPTPTDASSDPVNQMITRTNDEVLSESSSNVSHTYKQNKPNESSNAPSTVESNKIGKTTDNVNAVKDCSPYKLDTFISFNDSKLKELDTRNKNKLVENMTSSVEFSSMATHSSGADTNVTKRVPIINEITSIDGEIRVERKTDTNQTTEEHTDDVSTNRENDFGQTEAGTSTPEIQQHFNDNDATNVHEGTEHEIQNVDETNVREEKEIPESTNESFFSTDNQFQPSRTDLENSVVIISDEVQVNTEIECNGTEAILDDTVKLIIINGDDDQLLDDNEMNDNNLQKSTVTSELTMNTVVINEEPYTMMQSKQDNVDIVSQDENVEIEINSYEKAASDTTSVENTEGADTTNEETEGAAQTIGTDDKLEDFYLISEPRHVYEIVSNNKDLQQTLIEPEEDMKLTKKPKSKANTKKQEIEDKKEKNSPGMTKEKTKSTKQSPLVKDTLYSKISSSVHDSNEPNSNNLDFLNSSCKVTPAVKVLSTPKRKSSSTPRRSHVRALKFETPLKSAVLKRKCNTSPKECKNPAPFTYERVEKPKNVSRNLCEDVEMKKDKLPWDAGLRQLVKLPETEKLSRSEIGKRRRKNPERKRATARNEKSRKKTGEMKTITEELNNSHDNACNLDKSVICAQQDNTKTNDQSSRNEEFKTSKETVDCEFKSNEGSVLSLNIDDTPLKIADFQDDDIQDNNKTPSKNLILPSTNITFTPIDNIIRHNLGGSESLLKIIEDINMFKETPIKEALKNFSDKSKTPSPHKVELVIQPKKSGPKNKMKSSNASKSSSRAKNKRKVCNPKIIKIELIKSENATSTEQCVSISEEPSSNKPKTKRNPKRNQKLVEKVEQPVRRSLRSNSTRNKNNCKYPKEGDITKENTETKDNNEDVRENVLPRCEESFIKNNGNGPQTIAYDQHKIEPFVILNRLNEFDHSESKNKQNMIECVEQDVEEEENEPHTNQLSREKYEKISTFLEDCLSENKKLKLSDQNELNEANCCINSKKRYCSKNLEEEHNLKKKRKFDIENTNKKTSKNTKSGPEFKSEAVTNLININTDTKQRKNSKDLLRDNTNSRDHESDGRSDELEALQNKRTSPEIDIPIETQLNNNGTCDNMVESSDYPLNLSNNSSNKENSSSTAIDMNFPIASSMEINISSHVEVHRHFKESLDNLSNKNSSDSTSMIIDVEGNVDIKHADENNTDNNVPNNVDNNGAHMHEKAPNDIHYSNVGSVPEIISDDESEGHRLFLAVSYNDKCEPSRKELHDDAKDFNLEVYIGTTKVELSTFSYNVLDMKPMT